MPAVSRSRSGETASKQAWQSPLVETLPIRATATGVGVKWDSHMLGGEMKVIGNLPPDRQTCSAAPKTCETKSSKPNLGIWEPPAVVALSIRITSSGAD